MRLVFLLIIFLFNFNIVWGGQNSLRPSSTIIKLGTSLPLSGHAAYLGQEVLSGMQAYLKAINEKGGINGYKIVLKVYDDRYSPPLMIGNVKTLVEKDNVLALISLVGTPTTLTVVKYCEEKGIPLLFPVTGAIELRKPIKRTIFNLRPSYWNECRVAVDFLVKKGFRRFAIVYQHDAYGLNGLEGIRRRLFRYELEPIICIPYFRGQAMVSQIIEKLIKAHPDVVCFIGTSDIGISLIKRYVKLSSKIPVFYGVSFVGIKNMVENLSNTPVTLYMTSVFPYYIKEENKAIREYKNLMLRYSKQKYFSALSFEGFLNMKLLVMVLKNLEKNPSREAIIKALENIQNFDIGLEEKVSFGPNDHQGLKKVFLIKIKNGKIKQISTKN